MAWGGEDPEVYAGRDWHTDQGQHTFDIILCTDQNLEAGKLNRLAAGAAPCSLRPLRGARSPPMGEQPATLSVDRLRASRGGGWKNAQFGVACAVV